MTQEMVKKILINVLEDAGIYVDYEEKDDINISNYIKDSIQFISIIVAMEEKLKIEIPDELLIIDTFSSFNHLIDIICEITKTDVSEVTNN